MTSQPKMYREVAPWWQLLSAPSHYEEEAAFYLRTLASGCDRPPRTLLELGSGGGNNASHLKRHVDQMVLVDLSPGMLEHSRRLNPELEHHEGDMRAVRLGRQFDCVFVHDAVGYMVTEEDLRKAMETTFVHCRPGGAALFCPDYVAENFKPGTDCGGDDGDDGRAMRYLEWVWDPDPSDRRYVADYAYLLRSANGDVEVVHDRHLEGLFSRAEWLRWLADAGFRGEVVPFEHSELEPGAHDVLLARKPRGDA